jgi:hypothetical protein
MIYSVLGLSVCPGFCWGWVDAITASSAGIHFNIILLFPSIFLTLLRICVKIVSHVCVTCPDHFTVTYFIKFVYYIKNINCCFSLSSFFLSVVTVYEYNAYCIFQIFSFSIFIAKKKAQSRWNTVRVRAWVCWLIHKNIHFQQLASS